MGRGTRIDSETTQLTIRVSRRVSMRAERLIERVGRSLGVPATRTDVIREAILRGLEVLEAEAAAELDRRPPMRGFATSEGVLAENHPLPSPHEGQHPRRR